MLPFRVVPDADWRDRSGHLFLGSGSRVQGLGALGSGFRGLGFRFQGSGALGLGFRVQGLGAVGLAKVWPALRVSC